MVVAGAQVVVYSDDVEVRRQSFQRTAWCLPALDLDAFDIDDIL